MAFAKAPEKGLTPALLLFMASLCLARPGLYGFELGVLNTQQDLADARHRSAIGAVDEALTSFATLLVYGSGLVLGRPDQFAILVDSSTFFVSSGAVVYLVWICLYHSHRHRHDVPGEEHVHEHGHEHGCEHNHSHTLQQEEAMTDGWHEHIHFHKPKICTVQ
eukprot:Skav200811  [mRNA]  locus=scaffold1819:71750:72238:+ [translate_table: standard]